MSATVLHVDLFASNPLTGDARFLRRLDLDDPLLVQPDGHPTQLAEGWATCLCVSEPHTMVDCPQATTITVLA